MLITEANPDNNSLAEKEKTRKNKTIEKSISTVSERMEAREPK